MKKIINGKKYDTETAKFKGKYDNGLGGTDLDWYEESLYLKRTGEFFLYGVGNARSKYSEACGSNWWSGSSDIIPLSLNEAMKWSETHLDGDEYEAIFGEVEETGDGVSPLVVYLPDELIEKLKQTAKTANISVSDCVKDALNKSL